MNIFNQIKHAFQPVAHEIEHFNPEHAAQAILNAIENPIKSKLPGHLSLGEAAKVVEIAKPDAIDVDLFVGFGVDLGVELNMEFDLGVTWEDPVSKIGNIVDMVENPPETVHQLCDKLWGVVPSEVRVYERLQAVIGEQGQVRWYGPDVMERVTAYIGYRGWLDKKLRP